MTVTILRKRNLIKTPINSLLWGFFTNSRIVSNEEAQYMIDQFMLIFQMQMEILIMFNIVHKIKDSGSSVHNLRNMEMFMLF